MNPNAKGIMAFFKGPGGEKRGRNAFVRTKVPLSERVSSIVIVCLIAGIGVAIAIKGRHFDPNLYSLRADALNSTTATVDGKAGTLRAGTGVQPGEEGTTNTPKAALPPAAKTSAADAASQGEESSAPAASPATTGATAAASTAQTPMDINLPGIKPMGKTEFYNPDNLFEKIDGRSPAYIGFNFQALRSRSFSVDGSAGSYVDVYEYRMDTPINAFGMFALERDASGKPVDFAPDGYSGDMGFFFRQGAYYIQIIASDQNPKTMTAAKALAVDRAKSIPEDNTGLDGVRRLPVANMVAGSVTFVPENAQGQSFLKNVFQASYQYDGVKLSFFIMLATPQETAAAWKSYETFCGKFGKATDLPDEQRAKIFQAESFGKCKVIYQREGELGGVIDAQDAEKARKFVEEYLEGKIK
ncbi:MAG: DUF6599 family protein [Chthoniobacteraceae bacterium]